jgi:predicted component of type VI protein secretion system
MVKLTLFFKSAQLEEFEFQKGPISIGRDPDNAISIDSLAIAPRHARIEIQDGVARLRALDASFPVLIDGVGVVEQELKNGDNLTLGKHTLRFEQRQVSPPPGAHEKPQEFPSRALKASLQIMNGKNIGMILPLRNSLTRLGKPEQGYAIIAHRPEGFFLSAISQNSSVTLNDQPVGGQTLPLKDGDTLAVMGQELMFFLEK